MSESQELKPKRFHHKRKMIVLAALSIVSLVSLVLAAPMAGFHMPQTASPQTQVDIECYVDTVQWTNGTELNWGEVQPNTTYTKTLKVINVDTKNAIIYITIAGLPLGWTETWSINNTQLNAGLQVNGVLQLTTPETFDDPTPQTWDMWIHADPTT